MCTAVLSVEPGLPVLLAGIRDELTDRAWLRPGRHWPAYPGLIGGLDLQAGGTWLAVAPKQRRVSCVLNSRGTMAPAGSRRSRGDLPLRSAAGEPLPRSRLASFDPFHLLTAEPGRATMQSWDGERLTERELGPGLHFVVNSGLASDLATSDLAASARPAGTEPTGTRAAGTRPASARAAGAQPVGVQRVGVQPADGGPPEPADGGPPEPADGGPPEPADGQESAQMASSNAQAPNGRDHELARIAHFVPRFGAATRPFPQPAEPVKQAWGAWLPLIDGDGIDPGDPRALIVRRDLADGRTWGTTSISLVALSPEAVRYDFCGTPGDPAAWYPVPGVAAASVG